MLAAAPPSHAPASLASFYGDMDATQAAHSKWSWEPAQHITAFTGMFSKVEVPAKEAPQKKAALLTERASLRGGSADRTVENIDRIAEETREDSLSNGIAISDAFGRLEE